MADQAASVAVPPRLPLLVRQANRGNSTNKDARLVNCLLEADKDGEIYIYKRPGLVQAGIVVPDQLGRGSYFWRDHVYTIFGNTLFKDSVAVTGGPSLDTTGGVYRFDSNLGATPQLIFGNGKKTYAYTESGGVVGPLNTIDTDFPSEVVKGFAYLDGYSFVMMKDTRIFNSELNSVNTNASWNPINYIAAQIEPDAAVFLGKQLVYVVAFKQWTTEYFFDAGNPTGSPLGPVQGMKVPYGCANQDSVQSIDDVFVWLCTNRSASLQFISMDKGAVKIISTPAVDRLIADIDYQTNIYSWQLKINGHNYYVFTSKNANLTLVYDISMDEWYQWTDTNGNYFPIVSATYDAQGRHVLQHESNGRIYYTSALYYNDLDQPIQVDIYTPLFDANTRRRKQMNQMEVIGDKTAGSVLELRCTDDDYQSWSNWRRVDMSQDRPILNGEGTFSRRAYNLRHRSNTPFRIQAIEVQYDVGTL